MINQKIDYFPSMANRPTNINNANAFKARPMKHYRLGYNMSSNFNKIRLLEQYNRPGGFVSSTSNYCNVTHYSDKRLGTDNPVYSQNPLCNTICDPPTKVLRKIRHSGIIKSYPSSHHIKKIKQSVLNN
jgi:hypothetical protein